MPRQAAGGRAGSDVSGGPDSSAVAILASRHGEVRAVTYHDAYTSAEDLAYARRVAGHIGTTLHRGMDGVGRGVIWETNRHADMPDLAVVLNARVDVLERRLKNRGTHSRYEELTDSSARECAGYREAARFLMAAGVRVLRLDTRTEEPEEIARATVDVIREPWVKDRRPARRT
ncbi:asparagine synthase-related protein [Streptomyces sp. NPDC004610]|uniref:asparagine synthase-related protein n=1 Tax=unclassified Streptomyces TaxID=2593676 RepID=UPI0033A3C442